MRTEQKSNIKNSIGRLFVVTVAVTVQVYWIALVFFRLTSLSPYLSLLSAAVGLAVCLMIYGRHTNAAIKIPWIMLILVWPVVGLCLYALMGRRNSTRHMRDRFERVDKSLAGTLVQDEAVLKALEKEDLGRANLFRYLWKNPGYPVYDDTDVTFYPEASEGFEAQLEDLKRAKRFIFMEYYAIEEASAFARLKKVLADKVQEGVEVRVFYDDIGSISFINTDFIRRMEAIGVQCRVFNPIVPILNVFMNNRDHRKFTVIDGKIGYTGGYNLADEYFNITHPYGYWKDSGVRLEGGAVRSLTVMFLEMWNSREQTDDYSRYLTNGTEKKTGAAGKEAVSRRDVGAVHGADNALRQEAAVRGTDNALRQEAAARGTDNAPQQKKTPRGYVAPYSDSPLDLEHVGENVYMNVVKNARREVWFTTPYLIITDEMKRELELAAKRGVDVRIITPGIPDKKLVFQVTRSYYAELAAAGVRIYEYTPGFIHAKQCVADGEVATVGTVNLDYRSLYLHFEDGVLLSGCPCIVSIRRDFEAVMAVSEEVTEKYRARQKQSLLLWQLFLRLLSPLL